MFPMQIKGPGSELPPCLTQIRLFHIKSLVKSDLLESTVWPHIQPTLHYLKLSTLYTFVPLMPITVCSPLCCFLKSTGSSLVLLSCRMLSWLQNVGVLNSSLDAISVSDQANIDCVICKFDDGGVDDGGVAKLGALRGFCVKGVLVPISSFLGPLDKSQC